MKLSRLGSPSFYIALAAICKFALHMATAGQYGIFIDELYFLDCAKHLDWGYVDQPPLIGVLALISNSLLGGSLYGLRLLPALSGAGMILVGADICKELGGKSLAQILTAFALIPIPIYLMLNHWLTMNAFEPLIWMGVISLSLKMINRQQPRLWLVIGLICGLGMENKYTMLLPIFGLLFGLFITPQRKLMANHWFILGLLIGFVVFLPNLIWLIQHHFPFLEFEHNARLDQAQIKRNPIIFLADQIMIMNPVLFPVWAAGLWWLMRDERARPYRYLAWFFSALFIGLMLIQAKNYYLSPAYPVLIAAGAVAFEQFRPSRIHVQTYAASLMASGLILAPFVMPILPINSFIAYQKAFGGFRPVIIEHNDTGQLPLQFASEFGWEDMARQTAKLYYSLPKSEREKTAIFANHYGQAGAIDYYGPKYGLPTAISHHMTYWLWGPQKL